VGVATCDLDGAGILVTRAAHQADGLCQLIRNQGGRAIKFPTLEILAPADPEPLKKLISGISECHIAIFISPNAVSWGLGYLRDTGLPEGLKLAAVGSSTARALAAAGYTVDIVPDVQFDSEALLATPELQSVQGKRIIIFRGEGGRALLGDTLVERGADVVYAEVYRRACPDVDPSPLFYRWEADVELVMTSSLDVLENLFRIMGKTGAECLGKTPLVVVSSRMRDRARELGCEQIILAKGVDDVSLLEAACRWQSEVDS